jgi:hypothetical protein
MRIPLEWSSVSGFNRVGSSFALKYYVWLKMTNVLAYNTTLIITAVKLFQRPSNFVSFQVKGFLEQL